MCAARWISNRKRACFRRYTWPQNPVAGEPLALSPSWRFLATTAHYQRQSGPQNALLGLRLAAGLRPECSGRSIGAGRPCAGGTLNIERRNGRRIRIFHLFKQFEIYERDRRLHPAAQHEKEAPPHLLQAFKQLNLDLDSLTRWPCQRKEKRHVRFNGRLCRPAMTRSKC